MKAVVIANGTNMGVYQGDNEDEVLDSYANEVGYENYADLCGQVGDELDQVEVHQTLGDMIRDGYGDGDILQVVDDRIAEFAEPVNAPLLADMLDGSEWDFVPHAGDFSLDAIEKIPTDKNGNPLSRHIIVASTDHGDFWHEYDGSKTSLTPDQCKSYLHEHGVELPSGILDNGNALFLTDTPQDSDLDLIEPMT